jgi:hypothetical protein
MKNTLRIFLVVSVFPLAAASLPAQQPVSAPARENAFIDLSAGLINAVFARNVDQTDKINDVAMGIPVYGTAHTRGKVSAVPVPDAGNGVVDLLIRGTIVSDTVAVPPEKNLLIYSTTNISFTVRKRIYVNETGIHSFPTQARARANARLRKVTNLRGNTGTLATTIAEEVFEIEKPKTEKYAADQAEAQLIKILDDQIGPQIARANTALASALRQLQEQGVPLRHLHFSSTHSQLTLAATLLRPGQEPSITPPPGLLSFDLAARVHQSAVNETAQAVLGGKTFNVNDLNNLPIGTSNMAPVQSQLMQHFVGTVPHDLGVKVLAVTFADQDPISVAFADHYVTLTIRLKEISTTGLRLPGLTMRAVYKIENTPGRVELVRQGPVQVAPFYHARLGNRVLGALLQRSLDQVFKAQIAVPSLNPPAELSQIGTLVPAHGDAADGWLTLSWVRQGGK